MTSVVISGIPVMAMRWPRFTERPAELYREQFGIGRILCGFSSRAAQVFLAHSILTSSFMNMMSA
jgi:hypothetical protein